jgi:flagellar basal-body rod modification protein FlgD
MTIQGQNPITDPTAMTNQVASSTPTSSTSTTTPTSTPSIDGLATENTFLQLLVAQIKNQDPTNPTDSVQFLTQLAQFSQLEQLIGIRQELQPPAASTAATNQNNGTPSTAGTTN